MDSFLLGMILHRRGGEGNYLNQPLSNTIFNLSQIHTQSWTGENIILKQVLLCAEYN